MKKAWCFFANWNNYRFVCLLDQFDSHRAEGLKTRKIKYSGKPCVAIVNNNGRNGLKNQLGGSTMATHVAKIICKLRENNKNGKSNIAVTQQQYNV